MNGQRMYDLVDKMAFVRLSGTEEEVRAAQILAGELKDMGLEPVIEPFEVRDGLVKRTVLQVVEPYQETLEALAYRGSASTPVEGEIYDFLYVEEAVPANLLNAKGKFVLVDGYLNYDRYEKLMQAGVAGILTYSGSYMDEEEKTDLDTRKLREQMLDDIGRTVAVNVRAKTAQDMVQKGASKIRVSVQAEDVTLTSRNVICEIPGTDYPDQLIVLGGHYDSVPFSKGCYDNASGSAILIELARYFKANPPRRSLRFAWYGSEEQGLLGSKHDVQAHPDMVEKCIQMINVDMAGVAMGSDRCIVTGEMGTVHHLDQLFKAAGLPVQVSQDIYSSDCMPFADKGVPCVNLARFGANGQCQGHNRYDDMRFITAKSLQQTGDMAFLAAEHLVNAKVFPIEKKLPEEIVEKVNTYLKKKPAKA